MKSKLLYRLILLSVPVVIILSFSLELCAQTDTLKNPDQFLFRRFSKGRAAMKSGPDQFLILNYSIVAEKMVVLQRGEILELVNPASIDTIYLNDRRFIPVGKVFYEVLAETPFKLFVQHRGEVLQPVKTDPYGRASQASATSPVYNMKVSSIFYTLDDPDAVIKKETIYWINRSNSLKRFKDITQLLKIFPDFKSEIRKYIKQNNPEFENTDVILRLLIYCNSLQR
jgi:hypothetical protein